MPICQKCLVEKDASAFHKDKSCKRGLRYMCKDCYLHYQREWRRNNSEKSKEYVKRRIAKNPEKHRLKHKKWVAQTPEKQRLYKRNYIINNPEKHKISTRENHLRKYGITIEKHNEILLSQNGKCAICGTDYFDGKGGFCVDHNHDTGLVRGILCHHCNLILGHCRDNLSILTSAFDYLSKHKTKGESS